jgi:2,4-dienoyl-CoA reductase-like NADH-dependent reductase (Old Yellow Enzyme family)
VPAPEAGLDAYPHLFEPITVGTMRLRNRVMLPPHASAIGNIYGTDEDAERNIAYFEERVRDDGVAWVASLSTHLRNTVIPGFDPTGVGAATTGFFRLPFFVERVQAFSDALHGHGATVSVQMVHQGGMPHGASAVMSAPVINLMPHVMDQDDIDAFVREYAASARLSLEGRADGVEVHLNHDDIHEWFLSPFTNQRTDRYGGSLENRTRFAVETLQAIRDEVGSALTVGVRLNIREEVPGGYDVAGGVEIAQYLESTGLIDYVHGVVGSPWGNPSYIQPTYFDPAQWSALAGELTAALSIPVVHTGRINGPDIAERVLAAGHADIVGMARAHIAEGRLLQKAREGRVSVAGGLGRSEPARHRRRPGRHGARRADARVRVRRDALGGRGPPRRSAAIRGHGTPTRDVCGLSGLAGTTTARPRGRREAGSSCDGRRGCGTRRRRRGGGDGRDATSAADPRCGRTHRR